MCSIQTPDLQGSQVDRRTSECLRYLRTLFADAPLDSFIELRFRTTRGMKAMYFAADALGEAARLVGEHAPHTDTYVGVLPRRRAGGGRDDLIAEAAVLWADCDSPASVNRLGHTMPPPSMTVASGTPGNLHAYWLLDEPAAVHIIAGANRHLAAALDADASCTDPARILRPPSLNHKHSPPRPVRVVECSQAVRVSLRDFNIPLPGRARGSREARETAGDPLLRIEPARYVYELAGLTVGRDRKVRCPFHDDRTPSLHVYQVPQRGWFCFGCRRGGSVYDFAALLWGRETSGAEFVQLERQLRAAFWPE